LGRPIQYADLSSRLAEGLGLTGRDNWSIGEELLPAVITLDVTQLPYASEPRAAAGYGDITGVAAQSVLALTNQGTGVFWLQQIAASIATDGFIEISRSGQLAAGAASTRQMVDTSSKAAPNIGGLTLPKLISQWTAVVTTGPGIAEQLWASRISMPYPVNHLLRNGETCYVKTQTAAIRLVVGFSGFYYPNIETP